MEAVILEERREVMSMNPRKFVLWLFLVSITMLFAALTSAYIVKKADGNWLVFDLPSMFIWTTVVIAISSGTMFWSLMAARRDNLFQTRLGLTLTFILGVLFLLGQWQAWGQLVDNHVHLIGNVSGSFVYIISGAHGFHIVSGLVFLIIVLISAFNYKVHSKSILSIELCNTYWHYLGALWLFLYLFLELNN